MVLMARRMKDDDNLEEIKAAFKGLFKVQFCHHFDQWVFLH